MSNLCDTCGREVPLANDATIFHSIRLDDPDMVTCIPARHLLPIIENGHLVCPGFPSTAQYLNGYRTVKVFFLEPTTMLKYGFAYKQMQRQVAASETA